MLFVHAGLQADFVELCVEDRGIYLMYSDQNALKDVFRQLRNIYFREIEDLEEIEGRAEKHLSHL